MKKFFSSFLLSLFITNLCIANNDDTDTLRIEFLDNGEIELIDIDREYVEKDNNFIVTAKPIRVDASDKSRKKPKVVWKIDVQGGTLTVLSNYSQIPNDIGTEVNLDADTIANYRIYLSTIINNKHEIRFLYAPLSYDIDFIPTDNIRFEDSLLLMGLETQALYKFNSYRLSYIYHFDQVGVAQFRVGFTAKIRDAETALTQGDISESFTDLGFVPLLHLGAKFEISKKVFLDLEAEGSWAPQGYAVDGRFTLGYQVNKNLALGAGVGYLDGGANIQSVNTFARLFYAYGKIIYTFPVKEK
jgi:hypothetical protein